MANIGKEQREVEWEPLEIPETPGNPSEIPVEAPAEPAPTKVPEPV